MRIAIAKEAFNRKMSLMTSKLNEEIGQVLSLEHCFKWSRDLDTKKIGTEVFGELRNGEDKIIR